jgi:hypothetical protein
MTLLDRIVRLALKLQQAQRMRQIARMNAALDRATVANQAARAQLVASEDRIRQALNLPPDR